MANSHKLIPQINNSTRNWTSRVTVTEDIPIMTCGNGSKLKRYILTDNEGNDVLATIFDANVEILVKVLHQFQVYDITNARVKLVEPQYKILPNAYQWILQKDTLIRPSPQNTPNLRYFLDSLTPFNVIAKTKNTTSGTYDIMGAVVGFEAPDVVSTQYGSKNIQRFTFINTEKIPICVTLWGEMVESQGPLLMEAAQTFAIVVAKRLSLSTYKRTALSTKNCSSFTINPPIELAMKLKEWIQSRSETELQEMVVDKSLSISRELVTQGQMKLYTLSELSTVTAPGEYWIRGHLQISEEYQKFFYFECSNCRSKISANKEGDNYTCLNCLEDVVATSRPYVLMVIHDQHTSITVIAFDAVAERILQTTATQISSIFTLGEVYNVDSIKAELEGKLFQILVRRTFGETNDNQRKMLLVAYYEDNECGESNISYSMDKSDIANSPLKEHATNSPQSSLSPLKRQMQSINLSAGSPRKKLFQITDNAGNPGQSSKQDGPDSNI